MSKSGHTIEEDRFAGLERKMELAYATGFAVTSTVTATTSCALPWRIIIYTEDKKKQT